ncbi:hypothetical protein ES703_103369 [subsurface metagenome]
MVTGGGFWNQDYSVKKLTVIIGFLLTIFNIQLVINIIPEYFNVLLITETLTANLNFTTNSTLVWVNSNLGQAGYGEDSRSLKNSYFPGPIIDLNKILTGVFCGHSESLGE